MDKSDIIDHVTYVGAGAAIGLAVNSVVSPNKKPIGAVLIGIAVVYGVYLFSKGMIFKSFLSDTLNADTPTDNQPAGETTVIDNETTVSTPDNFQVVTPSE